MRLKNVSDRAISNNSIRLFINGQQKTPASFTIEANSVAAVVLSFASKESGIQQCRIEINDYPVTFDDKFYFSFEVAKNIPVLSINSSERNSDVQNPNNENKSLNNLFKDSLFKFTNVPESKIDYSTLSTYDLIIINEVKNISSGLAQELKRFVDNGGSLLIFPNANMDPASYTNFLSSMNVDALEKMDTANSKVNKINFDHTIYHDVFEKRSENIDLPVVLGHFKITEHSHSSKQFLLKLQNGDAFLSQYDHKKGKLYLSAVPLDPEYSNFTRHALFVPTLYKIAVYSQQVKPLFNIMGKDEIIEVNNISVSGENVFHIKGDNNFDIIPEHKVGDHVTDVFVHDQITAAGNYKLFLGDTVLSGLSFNFDRKESNLNCYSADELLKQKESAGLNNFSLLEAGTRSLAELRKATYRPSLLIRVWYDLPLPEAVPA